jgi:diguanylate cyclase (GGDEF)-like protein/PAS domain S-box-containing protein
MTEGMKQGSSAPLITAAVVFVVAALCSGLFVRYLEQQRVDTLRAQTSTLATAHADALQREIEPTLSIPSAPEAIRAGELDQLKQRGFDYRLELTHPDTAQTQIIAESSARPLTMPVRHEVTLPNGTWTLNLSPVGGWDDPLGLALLSGLGLIFSLLIAALAKLLIDARAQKRGLATLVEERTKELSESEARFRQIVETTTEGVWTVDREIRTTFANPRLAEMLGCPRDQLIGRSAFDFMDNETRAFVERKLAERSRDSSDQYELRLTRADGSQLWTFLCATPLRDADGNLVGGLGLLSDISERKRTEAALEDERQILKQAERIAQVGSWRWNIAADRAIVSEGWRLIHGIEDAGPMSLAEAMPLVHPDDRDAVQQAFDNALNGNCSFDISYRIVRRSDQRVRHLQSLGVVIRDDQGRPVTVYGLSQDITERHESDSELRIAAIAFEAQEGMLVTDAEERILRVNQAFTDILGYSAEESIGQTPRMLRSGRHDAAFFAEMWARILEHGFWEGEIWNRSKSGEVFPQWLAITAVRNTCGRITHYVGTLTDISQRKAADEEIRQLAFYDPLTKLPNRRLLLDRLRQALAANARSRQTGAALFIDLDNFKLLNDTRGHHIGDLLLEQVADRLTKTVRRSDSVARLGGDEFVILLQELGEDPEQAGALAKGVGEKVLAALGKPYRLAGHEHYSTPSIGIASFGNPPQSAEDILRQADLAMYQAKAAGRNTLRFYDPRMQESLNHRAALEAELRRAVEERQFVLHYQPQVDEQGQLTGAEALLRWHHPERGLLAPAEFMTHVVGLGLSRPLGCWVLQDACAQLAGWATRPETSRLNLAVNIFPEHFRRPEFVEDVRAALSASGADPRQLRLELTETPLLDDPDDTLAKMTLLKATGVGLTLDNFGVGYCSLSYLKRLPLDLLKIAPAFVREVLNDPDDDTIADRFVALAESLGLAIMAEGVETPAQRDYLLRHGCHIFQGYLFGRPGPVSELEAAPRSQPDPDGPNRKCQAGAI